MTTRPVDEHVPVLIVGAGLAGTSTAMFLGLHGVPALLVERHPSTSNQPKARGQSWHTMEALAVAGVAERVRAAGYDVSLGMPIVIAESVTGRRFHEIIGEEPPDWSHLSPATMAMASQERTEPILAERARELGAELRFSTRLESLDQDGDGVTAVVVDVDSGERRTVRADHVVAADGWRSELRTALSVGTHGRGDLNHSVHVVFDADLADVIQGREFALFYVQSPKLPGMSLFGSTDVPGRWLAGFEYNPDAGERPEGFAEADLVERIRTIVGIDDLDVRVVNVLDTGYAHRIADRFTVGRVHFVGDAAHTMPPHGGQGGNTAVMDGFYLAWKLAAVVRGWAGHGLLDSHDVERRPYGDLVAGQQYANMIFRSMPERADGSEDEMLPFEQFLFGYRYPGGAVVPEPDEDGARVEDPAEPTGRPGSRAPHVWLSRDGERMSTIDLYGRGFVLLTESPAWAKAAEDVAARLDVPLRAEVLGASGAPTDDTGRVRAAYGIGADGASLVRPDRFVAWRSTGSADADALERALRTVLDRD